MSPVHFKYIHDLHVHIFRNEIDRFLRIAFNGVSNWNRKPWDFHYLTLDVRSFVQNRWQINSLLNGVCIRNAHIFNCCSPAHSIDSDCLFSKKLNINHFQESKWEWKKIQFKLWITQSHSYNLSVLMLALATTFSEFNFDNSTDWLCCIIYWIFFWNSECWLISLFNSHLIKNRFDIFCPWTIILKRNSTKNRFVQQMNFYIKFQSL